MLFNSIGFAIFLPVIFLLYWFVAGKSVKLQNILLLFASYYFYACWDFRFMFLLMFSTFLDYYTGFKIDEAKSQGNKKVWLFISIFINLGFLCFFKYYNFFAESFIELFSGFGLKINLWTLKLILPVGISFYTFHGLSYVIDIYYGRIKPEKNVVDYSLFVSFFPLLVAGPIERATHLLPQIKKERTFDYSNAVDGLRQILWGLFKKVVIADSCAGFANEIFAGSEHYYGSTLLIGALFFTFQIYCDFSGYSDIALGTAQLFGMKLLRNFAFPYFSRDIAEFWRRWHISLSSWFRDYVYIPLGGSKGGTWMKVRNTFVIFLLSGFWHGANWTFIFWGFLNAIYFLPLLLSNKNRNYMGIVAEGKLFPTLGEFFKMLSTFMLTVLAWIFFRANSMHHAFLYISTIFSKTLFHIPNKKPFLAFKIHPGVGVALILFFMFIEWLGREQQYALANLGANWSRPVRWTFYYLLLLVIILFFGREQQFIYFQF
jgi:alginate O-acetyltransferase complex protein AlgI